MTPEDAMKLGPEVYNALYGPGWDKIPGAPEHREAQAYPDFRGLINEDAFRQAVEGFPMSTNVEDRRQPKSLRDYVEAARPFVQWFMSRGGSFNTPQPYYAEDSVPAPVPLPRPDPRNPVLERRDYGTRPVKVLRDETLR